MATAKKKSAKKVTQVLEKQLGHRNPDAPATLREVMELVTVAVADTDGDE